MDSIRKRKQGLSKTTWWGAVTAELKEMALTWGEAQHAAQDMSRWRQIIEALCPIWEEEDYVKLLLSSTPRDNGS